MALTIDLSDYSFMVETIVTAEVSGLVSIDIDYKEQAKPLMENIILRGAGGGVIVKSTDEDVLIDNELGYSDLSRYVNNKIVEYTDGICFTLWEIPDIPKSDQDIFYTVTAGKANRLELISYNQYGTTELWWVIATVNDISDPFVEAVPGTVLRVPALSELYSYFANKRS